jgi:hypothetical protein
VRFLFRAKHPHEVIATNWAPFIARAAAPQGSSKRSHLHTRHNRSERRAWVMARPTRTETTAQFCAGLMDNCAVRKRVISQNDGALQADAGAASQFRRGLET